MLMPPFIPLDTIPGFTIDDDMPGGEIKPS
jgi:hypothetical protein